MKKKKPNWDKIFRISTAINFMLLTFAFAWSGFITINQEHRLSYLEAGYRYKMYNTSNHTNVNGVYFPSKDYYCVWAGERDPIAISKTEAHEYCHYLIDNGDWSHFCT